MDHFNLKPLELFCPNCGHKLRGYLNEDGATIICCSRCGVKVYSKRVKKGFSLRIEQN